MFGWIVCLLLLFSRFITVGFKPMTAAGCVFVKVQPSGREPLRIKNVSVVVGIWLLVGLLSITS